MRNIIQKFLHIITLTDSNVMMECDKLSKIDRINLFWNFVALSLHMIFMTRVMAYEATSNIR